MRRLKPFQIALIAVGGTVGTIGIALGISFIVDVVEVLNWEDVEVPINQVSNISYGDGSVTYEDDNFTIEISDGSAEEKEAFLADADNGSLVQGTTKDGKNFEGRGNTIFLNTNNRIAQATVENKKDMDIAKAAGVTGQIVTAAGYEEGADDWSTDCNTYNMVEADCVVYYPAELRLKAESEDKIVFEDSRSKAVMTIILTDNTYTCMDEVEEFLYSDYEGNVLASGTDWYTTLVTDNGMATYDYVGLGNDYIVDCSLQYETKYDYVFTDLCSLIRCAFNEDGQWVSNALADTTGETVAVLASDPEEYDPEMKRTSYMFTDYECAVYYPNVFTKAYKGEDGTEYFTDPHTGAYISFTKTKTSMTSQEELVRDNMVDFVVELKGSNAVKGKLTTGSEGCFSYRAVKDGYLYSLDMTYPMDYDYVYSNAYELLEIALYGE